VGRASASIAIFQSFFGGFEPHLVVFSPHHSGPITDRSHPLARAVLREKKRRPFRPDQVIIHNIKPSKLG